MFDQWDVVWDQGNVDYNRLRRHPQRQDSSESLKILPYKNSNLTATFSILPLSAWSELSKIQHFQKYFWVRQGFKLHFRRIPSLVFVVRAAYPLSEKNSVKNSKILKVLHKWKFYSKVLTVINWLPFENTGEIWRLSSGNSWLINVKMLVLPFNKGLSFFLATSGILQILKVRFVLKWYLSFFFSNFKADASVTAAPRLK